MGEITTARDGQVLTVTIDRPAQAERADHVHDQMRRESAVFTELLDDPETKARIEAMRR